MANAAVLLALSRCVLTVTVDPSLDAVLFVLAPLNGLFLARLAVVIGMALALSAISC